VGDAGRLRQVLVNLVGNAVKFTNTGEVIVEVALDTVNDAEAILRFTVSDTGIGIPVEKQWQVFGAFVQADASTTRRFGGTGLGLTISAQLVEMMGGRIWLTSEVGQGSQFRFVAHFGVQLQPDAGLQPSASILRDLRVLVVDDNAANRTILQELLVNWQLHATAVESASAALAAMNEAASQDRPFHLVLTDALMPDVDGFALARRIAGDARFSGAKVIMLTSSGAGSGRQRAADRTIVAQLTKPVKQSDLLDAILTAFGDSHTDDRLRVRSVRGPRRARRLNVLVAEDNATNQKLVVRLLELNGHRVTLAGNGREAVEKAEGGHFDVILMDVQMPEMDGFEATQAIRLREGDSAHTRIVAMTAHAMAGDRERCLAAGMDAYVSKPLRPDDLLSTIDRLVAAGPAHTAATPENVLPQQPASTVDRDVLLDDFGQNPTLLAEVITVFLAEAPRLLDALRGAASAQDAAAVAPAAHALKGSIGLFSKGSAFEAARRLESAAHEGDVGGFDEGVHEIDVELSRMLRDLDALRMNLERPPPAV
jgi:CheY-like chemotaxis protein/HPt (histidine-containing phosphotransfer) domain-containing protein